MGRLRLLMICCMVLLSLSCKKKNNKQYSTWNINGVELSSNNVNSYAGYAPRCFIECLDPDNFNITLNMGMKMPKAGIYILKHIADSMSQDPAFASMRFVYKGKIYLNSSSSSSSLTATSSNNKAAYSLPPTWFIHFDYVTYDFDYSDSVLIHGIFKEP